LGFKLDSSYIVEDVELKLGENINQQLKRRDDDARKAFSDTRQKREHSCSKLQTENIGGHQSSLDALTDKEEERLAILAQMIAFNGGLNGLMSEDSLKDVFDENDEDENKDCLHQSFQSLSAEDKLQLKNLTRLLVGGGGEEEKMHGEDGFEEQTNVSSGDKQSKSSCQLQNELGVRETRGSCKV